MLSTIHKTTEWLHLFSWVKSQSFIVILSKLMRSVHIIHNNKPYDECKEKTNLDHCTFSFEIPSCYLHYCLVKALGCIFYGFTYIINLLGDSQRTSVSLPSASLRKYSAELNFHQRSTKKRLLALGYARFVALAKALRLDVAVIFLPTM